MARRKKGEGRGLEHTEVALMKRMIMEGFPRDRIMSFFVRPGRVISPAAIGEIKNRSIGADVEAASEEETRRYITVRLNEVRSATRDAIGGPVSPTRIREVLSLGDDAQVSLPGFESQFCEYKQQLPGDRRARVKIAKTASSFANSRGGYVFFGIDDSRKVCGIASDINVQRAIDALSQCINEFFAPNFRW